MTWLAVAAVFGAFARLNYFLYPSAYTDWVYFGDFFRLAFYVAILFAAVQEIRSYWEKVSQTAVLEERRRIARDLHDGLAQELAFIGRNLRSLDGDDPTVARVSASAARALSESRLAIAALTKPLDEPLEVALAQAARDTANREGTNIDLVLAPGIELDYRRRDALIRIACEAISNAARHGGASLVRVELENGRQVHLHVSDDGCGFDPDAVTLGGADAFGLTSMRERAHAFGGAFEVRLPSRERDAGGRHAVSTAVRVLLADDHVPTRHDIRRALESDSRFVVCAEAGDAPAAIEAAVRETPDICVLDVRMPGSGVAAAWEISSRLPQTKIVMLTVSSDDTRPVRVTSRRRVRLPAEGHGPCTASRTRSATS